jgi:hypothetical protein
MAEFRCLYATPPEDDMMIRLGIIAGLLFMVMTIFPVSAVQAQQDTSQTGCKPCRLHPQVIGKSFVVHGALRLYNGMPSARVWGIGTKRILGISEGRFYLEGYCNLPKWLEAKMDWDTEIIGDFVVYPFTKDKPGVMRLVCIDTAYNLKVMPWK